MISLTGPGTKGILLLFVVMTVLSCSEEEIVYPSVPSDTEPDKILLKAGEFETKAAQYKADYGTLVVPENRNKAESRLIELPVIRIHSSGNGPAEPIFYLAGGPGSSNMDFMPADYMLSNHDFVMVGYRGVDLDGYTMMEVIEDMEAARISLDYDRINLFSGIYGTRVAFIYGLKHPDIISRSVMIAVNPPGRFVWEPETVDSQLEHYADLWSKEPEMSHALLIF